MPTPTMDTISDKLALVDINGQRKSSYTLYLASIGADHSLNSSRVKEWLESPEAYFFHFHFESVVKKADYDLKSRLDGQHMRKMTLDVPVDIEDAIWKEKEIVDDDNFRRLVKRGDPLQFLLNAWITREFCRYRQLFLCWLTLGHANLATASELERQSRDK
ncbi:hypothetical protein C0991_010452 [Blastosporella zonata]|nr:hypothetical protein C0991_010452 [Blastosporella zonata]